MKRERVGVRSDTVFIRNSMEMKKTNKTRNHTSSKFNQVVYVLLFM